MRIIQDIGDLIIVALISPPLGWVALVGVLIFLVAILVAIYKTKRNLTEKMYWWGGMRSAAGKKRLVIVSAIIAVTAVVLFQIATSSSEGICYHGLNARESVKEPYSPSDEEFIRAALASNIALITSYQSKITAPVEKDKVIADFLKGNPDCCKVFRKRSDELGWMSWVEWRDSVVVRIRNEESLKDMRRGESPLIDDGIYYARVNNCSLGAEVIIEMIPGG